MSHLVPTHCLGPSGDGSPAELHFRTIPRGLLSRLGSLPVEALGLPWEAVAPALDALLDGAELSTVAARFALPADGLAAWRDAAVTAGVLSAAQAALACGVFLRERWPLLAGEGFPPGRDWPSDGEETSVWLVKDGHTASVWLVEPGLVTGREVPGSRPFYLNVARDNEAAVELTTSHALLERWARTSPCFTASPLSIERVRVERGDGSLEATVTVHRWVPGRELRVECIESAGRRLVARLLEVDPRMGTPCESDRRARPAGRPLSPVQAARIWRQLVGCSVAAARFREEPGAGGRVRVAMPLPVLNRGDAVYADGRVIVVGAPLHETVLDLAEWLAFLDDPFLPDEDAVGVHWPVPAALEPTVRAALEQNVELREGRGPAVEEARLALARVGFLPAPVFA
ncbi:MAG TPA: hypothetical protein VNJ71_06140 [Gemmatimonadales bacterium]|jgi:hypothetical protein|nr:hypothetical protein [Gemmatimonadales bacterium]